MKRVVLCAFLLIFHAACAEEASTGPAQRSKDQTSSKVPALVKTAAAQGVKKPRAAVSPATTQAETPLFWYGSPKSRVFEIFGQPPAGAGDVVYYGQGHVRFDPKTQCVVEWDLRYLQMTYNGSNKKFIQFYGPKASKAQQDQRLLEWQAKQKGMSVQQFRSFTAQKQALQKQGHTSEEAGKEAEKRLDPDYDPWLDSYLSQHPEFDTDVYNTPLNQGQDKPKKK